MSERIILVDETWKDDRATPVVVSSAAGFCVEVLPVSTIVEPAPVIEVVETLSDTSNACEDCPDTQKEPPTQSDCPYFEPHPHAPICTREGNSENALREWLR